LKETQLENFLRNLKSAAVAISGGVDSSFLLQATHNVLVDEAESFLLELGCQQVRVRCHDQGRLARIEADETGLDILAAPDRRRLVAEKLAGLGFTYISLDLQGYRTGSLNETLDRQELDS